ncbi:hypothetical protein [Kribbella lupini]|uniref:Uncharacterized protein n=1 Tax=Kribbella lupini TaxID=291602 RepID=A0ABN2C113_9ACTN
MSEPVNDYRRLPDAVRLEDTVTSVPGTPAADPDAGRNIDQDLAVGVRDLG